MKRGVKRRKRTGEKIRRGEVCGCDNRVSPSPSIFGDSMSKEGGNAAYRAFVMHQALSRYVVGYLASPVWHPQA